MQPAAILSVLVSANSTEATGVLSKYDRQLKAVDAVAKKGIQTRLGGTFDQTGFKAYEDRVARAARVAKDRAAFKAQLGADFNNSAFNAYERSVDRADKTTETMRGHTARLSGSLGSLAKTALEASGAFFAFEQAKGAIEGTLELARDTQRLTAVTGLDAKTASTWLEVTKVRGVSARQTGMAFITLSKQIKTAQDADTKHGTALAALTVKQRAQTAAVVAAGASQSQLTMLAQSQSAALSQLTTTSDKANAAFGELGVSQAALKAGDTSEVLKEAADGFKRIEDPARRAALAQQLFGRGSQALLPILVQGRKGVDDALAAAQRYGAFLPANVKQLQAAHEAQLNLNYAMDGLKISFTQGALPMLVEGAQKLSTFIAQMRSGKGAGGEFARTIGTGFRDVKTVVTDVVDAVGGIKPALEIAAGAFAASKVVKLVRFAGELGGTVRTLGSLPRKVAGVAAGGRVAETLTGTSVVRNMEVGTMIVRSAVGGGFGGSPGEKKAADTAAKDASKVGKTVTALGKIAKTLPFVATGIATAQALHVSPVAGAKFLVQNFNPHFSLPGDTAGLPHLISSTPPAQIEPKIPFLGRTQLQGTPAQGAALRGLALDAARAQTAMQTLSNTSAKAFSVISQWAKQTNDLRFSFADKVASDMLRAKGVNQSVVTNMLAALGKLPPGARSRAADTAIGMAAELQAKGALPKHSADRLRAAITASFTQMRIDSVAQARRMVTEIAGPINALFSTVTKDIKGAFSALDSLGGKFSKRAPGHGAISVPGLTPITHAARSVSAGTASASRAAQAAAPVARVAAPASRQTAAVAASAAQVAKLEAQIAKDRALLAATPSSAPALKTSLRADILNLEAELKAARANESAAKQNAAAQQRIAKKNQAILDKAAGVKNGVAVPSQSVAAQIQLAQVANQLQVAQNSNNTAGQRAALNAQLKLERKLLTEDQTRSAHVTKLLKNSHLSVVRRTQLLQDRLTLLQEIGNVEGQIGTAMSALASLTGTGNSSSTSQFDLAPTGSPVRLPTVWDVATTLGGSALRAARRHPTGLPHPGLYGHPVGAAHIVVSPHIEVHPGSGVTKHDVEEIAKKHGKEYADRLASDIHDIATRSLPRRTRNAGMRGT